MGIFHRIPYFPLIVTVKFQWSRWRIICFRTTLSTTSLTQTVPVPPLDACHERSHDMSKAATMLMAEEFGNSTGISGP